MSKEAGAFSVQELASIFLTHMPIAIDDVAHNLNLHYSHLGMSNWSEIGHKVLMFKD